MTRLATQCLKSAAVVAFALSIGTSVWAQAKPAMKSKPNASRPAAAMKTAPKAAWAEAQAKPRPKAETAKPHRSRPATAMRRAPEHAKPAIAVVAPSAPAPASTPEAGEAAAPAASDTTLDLVGKRDPFVALVNSAKGPQENLPPGKAGLVIGTLTVQGTVQGANGMIAVIANPDQRVYFVREGDRLYDGEVQKIALDAVTFQQNTKDAFGKPIERTVVKRIYPSAGEQQ
jgi:hypothetical protein